MRKNSNGSILLWSVFFMLFLSFSFLLISESIEQQLMTQYTYPTERIRASDTSDLRKESETRDKESPYRSSLLFERGFTGVLRSSESLWLRGERVQKPLDFEILFGGPMYVSAYSGLTLLDTQLVYNTASLTGNTFSLENLGGLCTFQLTPSRLDSTLYPYNSVIFEKNIGNVWFPYFTHTLGH